MKWKKGYKNGNFRKQIADTLHKITINICVHFINLSLSLCHKC